MADTKISALSALTAVDPDDLVPIVDDPAGTPVTKKITVANLVPAGINGVLFKALTADDAGGQNVNTAQPWFPTTGAVAVAGSTSYFVEGMLYLTRSAGTTSHSTQIAFGGTATITSLAVLVFCKEGDTNAIADCDCVWMTSASATTVKGASTSATENTLVMIRGIIRINGSGTLIPQFQYTSAPGGAPTVKANTYFRLWPIGDNTVATRGTWS